jgi:alpha/beta superfamily hydrolase
VGRWDFSRLVAPECPWLIVQGDCDELVSHERVAAWAAGFAPPPRLLVLAGVDHFFHGRLHQLRNAVGGFLQEP